MRVCRGRPRNPLTQQMATGRQKQTGADEELGARARRRRMLAVGSSALEQKARLHRL